MTHSLGPKKAFREVVISEMSLKRLFYKLKEIRGLMGVAGRTGIKIQE